MVHERKTTTGRRRARCLQRAMNFSDAYTWLEASGRSGRVDYRWLTAGAGCSCCSTSTITSRWHAVWSRSNRASTPGCRRARRAQIASRCSRTPCHAAVGARVAEGHALQAVGRVIAPPPGLGSCDAPWPAAVGIAPGISPVPARRAVRQAPSRNCSASRCSERWFPRRITERVRGAARRSITGIRSQAISKEILVPPSGSSSRV
jgi:hypothetical protein